MTKAYKYDKIGELTSSIEINGKVVTETIYAYDNNANRISVETKVGDTTVKNTYEYNELDQLAVGNTQTLKGKKIEDTKKEYIYDANGNLVKEVSGDQIVKQYSYDTEDRLKAIRDGKTLLMGALYDGDGERVFTLNGSQKYVGVKHTGDNSDGTKHDNCDHKNKICTDDIYFPYKTEDANQDKYELRQYINEVTSQYTEVLQEYGKKGELDMTYTYGLQRESYQDTKYKNDYMYDGRGSVSNIYAQKQNNMASYTYDAYGVETAVGKTTNTYGYNGESTDSNTGLQYLRARYYSSELGRFITKDSYAAELINSITRNRYAYTGNNPVNNIDPSGHFGMSLGNFIGNSIREQTLGGVVNTVSKTATVASKTNKEISNIISQKKVASNPIVKLQEETNKLQGLDGQIKALMSKASFAGSAKERTDILKKTEELTALRKNVCDSVNKLNEQQIVNDKVNIIFAEAHKYDWLKNIADSIVSPVIGFGASIFNNSIGTDFSRDENKLKNEKAYYAGAILGDATSVAIGIVETAFGLVSMVTGMIGTGGGTLALATGVGAGPGLVISAVSAGIAAAGAGLSTIGVVTIEKAGGNFFDNIQNFKDAGTQTSSSTTWSRKDGGHIDVENPNPGKSEINIHYQTSDGSKYYYNVSDNKLYTNKNFDTLASNKIQKLLKNKRFKNGITKALKYFGI